jgi:hypothetical protein
VHRDSHPELTSRGLLVPTIFHEPWWLKIASGGACREAVVSSDGRIVGRLPYHYEKRRLTRLTVLGMPTMTHALGPALAPEVLSVDYPRSMRPYTVTRDLLQQLPKAAHVLFYLHRGVTDTLAFEAAGYATGAEFTVEIAPAAPDVLWRGLRDKTRNVIRRAQEQLSAAQSMGTEAFLDFYQDNLRERGRRNDYDRDICKALISESLRRGCGSVRVAYEPGGAPQAAIFTVRDDALEYYFMSTRRLDSMNGAVSMLVWEALQSAAARGLTFDMDGIDSHNNLLLTTGFGGRVTPRLFASKSSRRFVLAQAARGWLR